MKATTAFLAVVIVHLVQGVFSQDKSTKLHQDTEGEKTPRSADYFWNDDLTNFHIPAIPISDIPKPKPGKRRTPSEVCEDDCHRWPGGIISSHCTSICAAAMASIDMSEGPGKKHSSLKLLQRMKTSGQLKKAVSFDGLRRMKRYA